MPITLSQLKAERRPLELEVAGDTIKFSYRPYALTPELEDQLAQVPEDGQPASAGLLKFFVELVADWDVKSEPGDKKPLEVTVGNLRRFPSKLIKQLFDRIREDQAPPKAPEGSFST